MSYNRCGYLKQAVDSVMAQTYQDFHILIVDDGSTDGAAELALDYQKKHPGRVSAVLKPARRGYADSLSLGLNTLHMAQYLATLDDDDLWHPEKLATQMRWLAERPRVALVATEALMIDAAGSLSGKRFSELHGQPELDAPARSIFWNGNRLASSSVVMTQAALELVTPYVPYGDGTNDMELWLTVAARMPIDWIAEPLTYVRHSPGQMTQIKLHSMWREAYLIRERALTSPAIRDAVGGAKARRRLDGDLVYWARWHARLGNWSEFAWYARRAIARRSLRLTLLLGLFSLLGTCERARAKLSGTVRLS